MSFRFGDFESEVANKLTYPSFRKNYLETLDEWLSEAIKDENWEAAEAFMAGILALREHFRRPR